LQKCTREPQFRDRRVKTVSDSHPTTSNATQTSGIPIAPAMSMIPIRPAVASVLAGPIVITPLPSGAGGQ
jgi:hypothetical protein